MQSELTHNSILLNVLNIFEQELLQQRDDILQKLEQKYIHYINQLLQQKLNLQQNIRKTYDQKIKYVNTMINKNDLKILQQLVLLNSNKLKTKSKIKTDDPMDKNIKENKINDNNDTDNDKSVDSDNIKDIPISQPSIPTIPLIPSMPPIVAVPPVPPVPVPSIPLIASPALNLPSPIDHVLPFKPHLTMSEASCLQIRDNIDHRDTEGCFAGASIIDKKGTNLKIHYLEWGNEWDIWSDYSKELYKFAAYKSISCRPTHRYFNLKKNDKIYIKSYNHPHAEWILSEIIELNNDNGQCKVLYILNDIIYYWWIHLDNVAEIKLNTTSNISIDTDFYCFYCDETFNGVDKLKQHIISTHIERKFVCNYCPEAFHQNQGLLQHEIKHIKENGFNCNLCSIAFKCQTSFLGRGALTTHKRRIHSNMIKSSDRKIKTIKTNWYSQKRSQLQRTRSSPDVSRRGYRKYVNVIHDYSDIDTDDNGTDDDYDYMEDMNDNDDDSELTDDDDGIIMDDIGGDDSYYFYCPYCAITVNKYADLRKHVRSDHSERRYMCDKCPEAFHNANGLRLHQNKHTDNGTYPCKICYKLYKCKLLFLANNSLTAHKRRMHANLYKKGSNSNINYAKNRRKKSKMNEQRQSFAYDYYCAYCPDLLNAYKDLRNHVISMHSDRQFICSECPQAFMQKNGLDKHLLQHELMSSQYNCVLCKYFLCKTSFRAQNALTRHQGLMHKNNLHIIKNIKMNISISGNKRKQHPTFNIDNNCNNKKLKLTPSLTLLNEALDTNEGAEIVDNHYLWKQWKLKEKEIKLIINNNNNNNKLNKILTNNLKQFIIKTNLCNGNWMTSWDNYSFQYLRDELLFDLCLIDANKQKNNNNNNK